MRRCECLGGHFYFLGVPSFFVLGMAFDLILALLGPLWVPFRPNDPDWAENFNF